MGIILDTHGEWTAEVRTKSVVFRRDHGMDQDEPEEFEIDSTEMPNVLACFADALRYFHVPERKEPR